jgi:hypothetical protein
MSGATALGGIFSARAISFGMRPASAAYGHGQATAALAKEIWCPEPAALLG